VQHLEATGAADADPTCYRGDKTLSVLIFLSASVIQKATPLRTAEDLGCYFRHEALAEAEVQYAQE
jgi:hypothetical protein